MRQIGLGVGILMLLGTIGAQASSLSIQGTYWDADLAGEGYGGGIKFKHYVSARLALHVGYRYYDHNVNPDLHTALGGIQLLL